jgi:hypothetical protein
MATPPPIRQRGKPAEQTFERSPIYIDLPEGPRLIRRTAGERLNFLYEAWIQARQSNADAEASGKALYTELSDYYGVVLRKEANRRGWHLPEIDTAADDLGGFAAFRPNVDEAPRLDKLLPPQTRHEAAAKVFSALDTYNGKSKFHTWAYSIIHNVIMDAISDAMNTRASRASGIVFSDPAATASGARGGKMTKNYEEIKTLRRLDYANIQSRDRNDFEKKSGEWWNLLSQQSKTDQRFITLWINSPKGSSRAIAKKMRWPIKKAYNRAAKFKKLGLLHAYSVDSRKREYNRRHRQKLAKRN